MFFSVTIKIHMGTAKTTLTDFIVSISVTRSTNWMPTLDLLPNELAIWLETSILTGTTRTDDHDNGDDALFLFFTGLEFATGITYFKPSSTLYRSQLVISSCWSSWLTMCGCALRLLWALALVILCLGGS